MQGRSQGRLYCRVVIGGVAVRLVPEDRTQSKSQVDEGVEIHF